MRILATLASALALVLVSALGAFAQEGTGTVTVVHAVPDTPVDVYVNGELTLEGFAPKTVTDPLELPAGDYDIAVRAAGAAADSEPVITGAATLPAGANASIVAHLTADGAPTLSVFVNDTSTIAAGNARVTVRHTAAAPAVDVLADGGAIVSDLSNPNEASLEVPAATYSVAVAAAGTTDPVIGPVELSLAEGTSYLVYAFGSLDAGNLDLLVQTISGLHSTPTGVPSGTGGQSATGLSPVLLLAGVLALAGITVSTRSLARTRA